MRTREIMTASPRCASTSDTVETVARLMRDADCGSIPIADDETGKVVGIVTDRDLAIRVLAAGRGVETPVTTVMTGYPFTARAEDDLRHVENLMAEHQVRRVPVVDVDNRCIGIVSQGDIARAALDRPEVVSEREVAIVVERISNAARPRKSDPRFAETLRMGRTAEQRPDAGS